MIANVDYLDLPANPIVTPRSPIECAEPSTTVLSVGVFSTARAQVWLVEPSMDGSNDWSLEKHLAIHLPIRLGIRHIVEY
eukprot:scaffold3151_cov110-Cylindrotheca_fusiformis.AAC.13